MEGDGGCGLCQIYIYIHDLVKPARQTLFSGAVEIGVGATTGGREMGLSSENDQVEWEFTAKGRGRGRGG